MNTNAETHSIFRRRAAAANGEEKKDVIHIKGARMHNLKNIELVIPRNKFIVITGLSGSGKSTLAFDTIFAEGQRRYVESLSAYARQFLGRINKPDVDFITGIPPAIAIEQKVNTRNPRSTVGTSTEIYDYLKLLFARIGRTVSPVSGQEVKRDRVTDVVNYIASLPVGTRLYILAPLKLDKGMGLIEKLTLLQNEGFTRIEREGEIFRIETILPNIDAFGQVDDGGATAFRLLIDRVSVVEESEVLSRVADSVQTAFAEGEGRCIVLSVDAGRDERVFSSSFEADGIVFEEPSEYLFSFNSPYGACPLCDGFGKTVGVDEDLVIPDRSLSVFNDAIACWRSESMRIYKDTLVAKAHYFDFPIHRAYYDLSDAQRKLLWDGNKYFTGIHDFFKMLETHKNKVTSRVLLNRYRGKMICPECRGMRLRKETGYVYVGGKTIGELVQMPVGDLDAFFQHFEPTDYKLQIAQRSLLEIRTRLQFLLDVGLGYLTLNRLSNSLSGGESQRINLATSLGSSLVGSLYILDEPSIGLHSRDTQRLVKVLKQLRDMGNTVIVVEHEEEIICAADEIIDIGPLAGHHGGKVVYQGPYPAAAPAGKPKDNGSRTLPSLTLAYLNGIETIDVPAQRRPLNNYIEVVGARENNLKNLTVRFPLGGLVTVTGVSGSGKSSLVKNILYPALERYFVQYSSRKPGLYDSLRGDLKRLTAVEFIDQNPIGKSSRSNPVTYIKAFDDIRKLYSEQPYARAAGYDSSHFSFNIAGGRCEDCLGEGTIRVEMQFMADVMLVCETCGGMRFQADVLAVHYKGKSIAGVLDMTVNQAIDFFDVQKEPLAKRIAERLLPLQRVGLGYVKLGQASSTLSGGESQRVKLASFLAKEVAVTPILFIFDEPTTGLHFHDIKQLLNAFQGLISRGHSIIVVEHNVEIIKNADWVIELGPEGGEKGGRVVFAGTPEQLAGHPELPTGKVLAKKLGKPEILK
ncbi:MAG: excinuclease ABC subunit UvrA [Prevotellaceae bacterium]|jgi:excinuclease ABC subunit A|nr:excinuclease ABC subunit UvrA [Prevotellaceae bacterium]